MSTAAAAITLQCPNCGGVFLTLQHSGHGMEICPHCAVAAPRGSYRNLNADAILPRSKTALPSRKAPLTPTATTTPSQAVQPQPVVTQEPVPVLKAVPPPAQPPPAEPPRESLPHFPMAPAAVAPMAVPTLQQVFSPPPAPVAFSQPPPAAPQPLPSLGGGLPPPQIGFAPVTPAPVHPSPFAAVERPALTPFSVAEQAAPPPAAPSATLPPRRTSPPVWPGLGLEGEPGPIVAEVTPRPLPAPRPRPEAQVEEPVPESLQNVPWIQLVFFFSLLTGLGFWMWHASLPVRLPVLARTQPAGPLPEPAPVVPAPVPLEPPVEVRKAEPGPVQMPTTEMLQQATALDAILRAMDASRTDAERLRLIADPDIHAEDVLRFFASPPGRLATLAPEPNPAVITLLPSGGQIQLFRAVTTKCPSGAMARVIPAGDGFVLDWPLFRQSHDLAYDRFLARLGTQTQAVTPQWFHLLMARTRGLQNDASPLEEGPWLLLNTQGSLSGRGESLVRVPRDSDVGRLLSGKMEWARVYLAEVLIGAAPLDGRMVPVVLDLRKAGSEDKKRE